MLEFSTAHTEREHGINKPLVTETDSCSVQKGPGSPSSCVDGRCGNKKVLRQQTDTRKEAAKVAQSTLLTNAQGEAGRKYARTRCVQIRSEVIFKDYHHNHFLVRVVARGRVEAFYATKKKGKASFA